MLGREGPARTGSVLQHLLDPGASRRRPRALLREAVERRWRLRCPGQTPSQGRPCPRVTPAFLNLGARGVRPYGARPAAPGRCAEIWTIVGDVAAVASCPKSGGPERGPVGE